MLLLGALRSPNPDKNADAEVTYSFGCTFRLTITTDSLESGKSIALAVILKTRLHTAAYARALYTFLKTNPDLWTVEDS